MQKYRVSASELELLRLKSRNLKGRTSIGYFPSDRADCKCQSKIQALSMKFSVMKPIEIREYKEKTKTLECPADKKNMKKFLVKCGECGAEIGTCYASDSTLSDWVDFHYIVKSVIKREVRIIEEHKPAKKTVKKKMIIEKAYWVGALAINISPIDQKLGFECSCGNDTRDFRANQTLTEEQRANNIKITSKGRGLGKKNSRFLTIGA